MAVGPCGVAHPDRSGFFNKRNGKSGHSSTTLPKAFLFTLFINSRGLKSGHYMLIRKYFWRNEEAVIWISIRPGYYSLIGSQRFNGSKLAGGFPTRRYQLLWRVAGKGIRSEPVPVHVWNCRSIPPQWPTQFAGFHFQGKHNRGRSYQ